MRTELDTSGLDALTARLRRLSQPQTEALLKQLGAELVEDARYRIRVSEAGPDGRRWPTLSRAWSRRTVDASDFLQDTEAMLESLQAHLAGSEEVDAGSPLVRAAVHQWGSRKRSVPARPFLGVGEDDADELELIAATFLDEALRGEVAGV